MWVKVLKEETAQKEEAEVRVRQNVTMSRCYLCHFNLFKTLRWRSACFLTVSAHTLTL